MASGEGNKQKQKRNLNSTCSSRGREWTQNEMVLFAKIMVDEEDGSLDELALKKATNNEIFRYVKIKFDEAGKEENFHEQNVIDNFTSKRRFLDLDTSIEKLRRKYTNLKQK